MQMYKKFTLENGLRVILAPRTETQSVTVLLGVWAGSRYEKADEAGISHFVEHMNFKGTKKRPTAIEVSHFINDIGGMYNAYTDKEHTVYYVKISSDHLDLALDYISDNVINSLNLKEEFEREKGVVIEDVKMHKDRPMEEVEELFEEAVFSDESLARRITGTVESVAGITLAGLKNYRDARYVAGDSVLAVVGNFGKLDETKLIEKIEQYFKMPGGKAAGAKESGQNNKQVLLTQDRKTEQTNLIVGFPGPGLRSDDKYAFRMLARILGGSSSSRMFIEVREKRGLAYAVETAAQSYSDAGSILTLANVAHFNVEAATGAVIEEYRKITRSKVTAEELKRAKEITKGGILIGLEDSETLADMLVATELNQNGFLTPEEVIKHFLSVTEDEVLSVAQKYLNFDKLVITAVGPKINKKALNKIMRG